MDPYLFNPPNLEFLKSAWSALQDIHVDNLGNGLAGTGLSFTRVNHSTLVRKGEVQVATLGLEFARQDLKSGFLGRIENEVRKVAAQIESVLIRDLVVPEDHVLRVELNDCIRKLRRGAGNTLSVAIEPTVDATDRSRLRVDMRFFLDTPRAVLFATLTRPSVATTIDILADCSSRERKPRATSYAALAEQAAAAINRALAPYVA